MDASRVEQLFEEALSLPLESRDEFLREQCGDDAELLERLRRMLSAPDLTAEMSVLANLGIAASAFVDEKPRAAPRPGDRLGAYTLLRSIGAGSYGEVFLAEQSEPVRRRVAIKVLHPQWNSARLAARFRAEWQSLAKMDHPNIAKVFDAGQTDWGLPYLVMQYVAGEPITTYCDSRRLSIEERLELFAKVCEAVQHAHTKSVVHRDLKPANVLVTSSDGGGPEPMVIDFGVAKVLEAEEREAALFRTEAGFAMGTFAYMSPEQAAADPDVDTKSDVYSLGVMLYELMSGSLPFTGETMKKAAEDEIRRMIREDDPPSPSARVSKDATGTAVAQARKLGAGELARKLRSELEWIPLHAMKKHRERRYGSASQLGDDVRNYLSGRPLIAAPESRWYLARKFVRRHRGAGLTASAVFLSLAAGLGVALWQARVANARADELKQVSDFQENMLGQIDPTTAGVRLTESVNARFAAALEKARVPDAERRGQADMFRQQWLKVNATDTSLALIDETILKPAVKAIGEQFKNQPIVDAKLRQVLAYRYCKLGMYEEATPLQKSALATRRRVLGEEHPDTFTSIGNMGVLLQAQGKLAEAEPYYREALEKRRRVLGEEHPDTLASIGNMGFLLQSQGRFNEAEPYHREALEKQRRVLGEENPHTIASIGNMGVLLQAQGKLAEAEQYYREALEKKRRVLGEEHPGTVTSICNLGELLRVQGKLAQAEPYFREALEKSRRVLGEDHPTTLSVTSNLGVLLQTQGKPAEAEPYVREALEKRQRLLGEEHPGTITSICNLGELLLVQGKLARAEPYLREALEKSRRVLGEDHPTTLSVMSNLGVLLQTQGKPAEAEPYVREALEKRQRLLGEEHQDTLVSIMNMGLLLHAQGKLAEAERYYREAIERSRRVLGEEHPSTLISISGMGGLLRSQGKFQEAVDLLAPAEPAARRVFTGGNARRLASFLTYLGRCRTGLGYNAERFALAEANLLEAHPIFVKTRGETHKDTLGCVHGLVNLYVAWDNAEPDKGYDAKAGEWKAKLESGTPEPAKP